MPFASNLEMMDMEGFGLFLITGAFMKQP